MNKIMTETMTHKIRIRVRLLFLTSLAVFKKVGFGYFNAFFLYVGICGISTD